jgi:glutaredoxin
MDNVTLYQFELCPYCHKVKAAMEAKGIAFTKVEVNPMNKKELPPLPEGAPRKVPVIRVNGDTVFDSTKIVEYLEARDSSGLRLTPADPKMREKSELVERWVNDDLSYVLPTVIYGTWGEALKAAQVVAKTSNFGFVQNAMVRAGGSLMPSVATDRRQARRHPASDARGGDGQVRGGSAIALRVRFGDSASATSPARLPRPAFRLPGVCDDHGTAACCCMVQARSSRSGAQPGVVLRSTARYGAAARINPQGGKGCCDFSP